MSYYDMSVPDAILNAERARHRANRTSDTSSSVLNRDRLLLDRKPKLLKELQDIQERQDAQSREIAALQEIQKKTLRLLEHINHHLLTADSREHADRDSIPSAAVPQNYCTDPNYDGNDESGDDYSE